MNPSQRLNAILRQYNHAVRVGGYDGCPLYVALHVEDDTAHYAVGGALDGDVEAVYDLHFAGYEPETVIDLELGTICDVHWGPQITRTDEKFDFAAVPAS